jgi:hypothetical protein
MCHHIAPSLISLLVPGTALWRWALAPNHRDRITALQLSRQGNDAPGFSEHLLGTF